MNAEEWFEKVHDHLHPAVLNSSYKTAFFLFDSS
jgi:hypothetical protein